MALHLNERKELARPQLWTVKSQAQILTILEKADQASLSVMLNSNDRPFFDDGVIILISCVIPLLYVILVHVVVLLPLLVRELVS